ncbi:hypothetical protein BCR42DRAFT_452312 [Absidia repens]|uniref:Uncharacterized protein n=1 Tax=Absidia repens TaxID=90262 RepID=A0A1X2IDJ0_9FUNG|nr:hypothetical protein BCR42DRAFT_452312 [Absidia repens]
MKHRERQADKYEGFDCGQMKNKFETKYGPTGSRWLSVIGSLLGTSRDKIKNIEIICDGKEIKGAFTIGKLMASGDLANKGIQFNKKNRNLYYIGQISAALPQEPFLFLEALQEDDETVANVIGYEISTSLPRSLRYTHAAALPLGPKTRKAHILWSKKFAALIKSSFNISIYQRRAQEAEMYRSLDHMMALLNSIESSIVLTNEEKKIQWVSNFH